MTKADVIAMKGLKSIGVQKRQEMEIISPISCLFFIFSLLEAWELLACQTLSVFS